MTRRAILILSTTFAAGLLFVNVYNSIIDATSWGSDIPSSIQTARDYFKTVNPGNFFRVASPINQVLALLALILCWKVSKRVRILCALALFFAVVSDVFTMAYFFPRNDIMFFSSISENLNAIKDAWNEWSSMNWLRSFLVLTNLAFDFAAFTYLLKESKS